MKRKPPLIAIERGALYLANGVTIFDRITGCRPMLALVATRRRDVTATATPIVQDDISQQLADSAGTFHSRIPAPEQQYNCWSRRHNGPHWPANCSAMRSAGAGVPHPQRPGVEAVATGAVRVNKNETHGVKV